MRLPWTAEASRRPVDDVSLRAHRPSATLVDHVRAASLEKPERLIYRQLSSAGGERACLTLGELDRQARTVGAALLRSGMERERALLLYPSGLEFITAFLGCLYA